MYLSIKRLIFKQIFFLKKIQKTFNAGMKNKIFSEKGLI